MTARALVSLVVLVLPLLSDAQPPKELTGVYVKEGGELAILQGSNETLVRYEAGFAQGASVGTCECSFVVRQRKAGRWTLVSPDSSGTWTLKVEPQQLVLEGNGQGCCGMGWSGRDTFARGQVQALRQCKVKPPRAYFFALDSAHTRRKAYVTSGDRVEVLLPPTEPSQVPARFQGPRRSTVGMLEREALDCPEPGAQPR